MINTEHTQALCQGQKGSKMMLGVKKLVNRQVAKPKAKAMARVSARQINWID